jgi:hypothetical protein
MDILYFDGGGFEAAMSIRRTIGKNLILNFIFMNMVYAYKDS